MQSISDFLQASGFSYHVYDLGRRVQRISPTLFAEIEQQTIAYPYPLKQTAWLGIIFYQTGENPQHIPQNTQDTPQKITPQPVIWFLKFPLDEMGLLSLQARDGFLQQLLKHLGENIKALHHGEQLTDALQESPFAFKPKQERLAMFHALVTQRLDLPPSQYYAHVQAYLQGKLGFEQWAFLGLQGMADLVARLTSKEASSQQSNQRLLSQAINQLPDTPLILFAQLLENVVIDQVLSKALEQRLHQAMAEQAPLGLIVALLQGLSNSDTPELRYAIWRQLLNTADYGKQLDVLVVLSGRAWRDLLYDDLLIVYLEQAAQGEQAHFNALLLDLMALPDMRPAILALMEQGSCSLPLTVRFRHFKQGLLSTETTP
ncbi:MAG: DUF3549 family protein [bacterium]